MYFNIVTLGCKVNSYESEAMEEILFRGGYQKADENNIPDVVIINTCAVTGVAGQKSRQQIHKARRAYPNAIIVGVGCFVQLAFNDLVNDGVDILMGTDKKAELLNNINAFRAYKKQEAYVDNSRLRTKYECINIQSYDDNTRAFVKIQDGCNNFCSYCIIPYTRGAFRSRPRKDVLQEISNLVKHGYQEIVLTGIDTAEYGKDINESFVSLLKEILNDNKDLKRLRISSIEASQISDEFIDLLIKETRIARHLHIPLQSGSSSVLKRMNRKYTVEEFYSKIKKIRQALPSIALACDVIAGFPQETEEEHLETMNFIRKCGFDYLHVFPYSIRPGTPAAKMKPQVASEVKKRRVKELIELGNVLENNYKKQFDNQELDVLFEDKDNQNYWRGYSSNYIYVKVKSDIDLHNTMCKVRFHLEKESEISNLLVKQK